MYKKIANDIILPKIRRQLLTENKFSKFLLYAIGEIILVVIGILVALQITNWNESVKIEQKETDHLVKLFQNLKLDSFKLKLGNFRHRRKTILINTHFSHYEYSN